MAKRRKIKNSVLLVFLVVFILIAIFCVFHFKKDSLGLSFKYKTVENFKVINKELECNNKIVAIGKIKEVNNINLSYSCNSEQVVFYKDEKIITNMFLTEFVQFYNVDEYLVIKYSFENSKDFIYKIFDKDLNVVNAIELDDSILNEVYDV